MKKQTLNTILGLAVLGCSPAAHASGVQDLQGTWIVIDRVCTDGNRAQDRVQLGRDSIEFTVSGNQIQIRKRIEGVEYSQSGQLMTSERQLVTTQSDGTVHSMLYMAGKGNELALISAKFGQGGSCAEGEALMTVLRKK